jgi:hypothetical protein
MHGDFSAAMRAGDIDRAERLLPALAAPVPDHLLRSVADLHMSQQRWREASETLARMKHRNVDAEMNRKLCANLAALKTHRPHIYKAIIEAEATPRYSIAPSKTGHPTIVLHKADRSTISMSADNDPLGGVSVAMSSIDAAYRAGKAIGLAGIGDGYLLAHLARNPPELILGREQAICVIEPDASLLLTCLMLHDYTGSAGPIEQQRISWYVGSGWATDLRDEFFSDLFKMYPGVTIRTGLQPIAIEQELEKFLKEIGELDKQFISEIEPHYQQMTREQFVEVMSENPPRKPRALVMTTRFSTVLQYSAADTAEAFRELGWDVHLLIEPTPWHGMNRIAMRQAVATFKPDVVFQIDHLRSEYNDLFPKNLPSICWIQDHLPNLLNSAAGASVTLRDFVLTNCGHRYEREYGYPPRQLLHMTKATKVPAMRISAPRDHDIVFVSNAGRMPESIVEETLTRIHTPREQELVRAITRRMIDHYAGGACIETLADLDRFVNEAERDLKRMIVPIETRKQVVSLLWHPLNDMLYRQQSLSWVADAAEKLGLRLELYGQHWDKHPRFARFAKGYVNYGDNLEELTRRSRISLHIAPFSWLHQRVMDGYVAGGFFLMRRHLSNFVPYELNRFAERRERGEAIDDARLGCLMEQYRRLNELCDPIQHVRELAADRALHELPLLDEISFADQKDCERLISHFTNNSQDTERVASQQREYVLKNFTYASQMKRIVGEVSGLIRKEAA